MVLNRSCPAVSHYIDPCLRSAGAASSRLPPRSSFSVLEGRYEIDTDGVVEGGGEVVLDVSHEHAGFPDAGVADDQNFEQLGLAWLANGTCPACYTA